jgi:flagellar basal-body rod modification protein FlgD
MTTVNPVAAPPATSTPPPAVGSATTSSSTGLTSQDFLDLLSAQLEYQDPLDPTSSSQLMSQTTSLESLEEMTSLTSEVSTLLASSQANQATSLIGKTVIGVGSTGATVEGVVTGVQYESTGPVLSIGTETLPLSAVQGAR